MKKLLVSLALLVPAAGLLLAQAPAKGQRSEAEKKALARVQQLGGLALELAQNDSHLEVSYLQRTDKFSDDCLLALRDLQKGLVHLNLRGLDVTDASLAHLAGLTGLTRLHLERTKITDAGLVHLKGLTNLEYLNLYGTQISDAGLANLAGMKKLKHLYLWQTKVTDAGVARLKKALPQTDVVLALDLAPVKEEPKAQPKAPAKKAPAKAKTPAKKEQPKAKTPAKKEPAKPKEQPKKEGEKKK